MTISILDYGLGNLKSLSWSLERIGCDYIITRDKDELLSSDKIIVPGVGSFGQAIENIHSLDLFKVIKKVATRKGTKLFGICLGMQIFFEGSDESPQTKGLSLLSGKFEKLEASVSHVPHMGWNNLELKNTCNFKYLENIEESADFYFVHSYYMNLREDILSYSVDYGGLHTCYVQKANVFGAQFHPEKSHDHGLQLLSNFLTWDGTC